MPVSCACTHWSIQSPVRHLGRNSLPSTKNSVLNLWLVSEDAFGVSLATFLAFFLQYKMFKVTRNLMVAKKLYEFDIHFILISLFPLFYLFIQLMTFKFKITVSSPLYFLASWIVILQYLSPLSVYI